VAIPVNFWQNGEFKDQIDPKTYEFTTLSEMFARDVAQAEGQEYVSPDGSLVLPAWRVLRQGPADHMGYRWSDTLDTHGFTSARVGERVVFTNGSENRTFSGLLGAGGAITDLKRWPTAAAKARRWDRTARCMSPTARSSSTARIRSSRWAASTCRNVRCS
jgi:hypothetical protein